MAKIQVDAPDLYPPKPINFDALKAGKVYSKPYKHMVAERVLHKNFQVPLDFDFPQIKKHGFFPLDAVLKSEQSSDSFNLLIEQLEGPEIAEILSEKLEIDITDKPRIITVRKWSAATDGRIHNDGESKIVTALIYPMHSWPVHEKGGRFAILSSKNSFDDTEKEVWPEFGNFVAFVRSDNSWHGHKPYVGERRVIQVTWLRSQEDAERKRKRGLLSHFWKKFLPSYD